MTEPAEVLQNFHGEVVEVYENEDGTATGVLEGEARRTWASVEEALEALYKAGWRF